MIIGVRSLSLFSIGIAMACGCGSSHPPLIKVTGKVTLDGKPLEGAQVALQPILTDSKDYFQRPSSGFTNETGEFVPQTYLPNDGLRAGKYRVAVVKREMMGSVPPGVSPDQAQQFRMKHKWITPRSVATAEKSGIEVEVTSSGIKPDIIDLKSVQPPEIE